MESNLYNRKSNIINYQLDSEQGEDDSEFTLNTGTVSASVKNRAALIPKTENLISISQKNKNGSQVFSSFDASMSTTSSHRISNQYHKKSRSAVEFNVAPLESSENFSDCDEDFIDSDDDERPDKP